MVRNVDWEPVRTKDRGTFVVVVVVVVVFFAYSLTEAVVERFV